MIIMHTTCHREFGGLEKRIFNESCKMAEKGHKIIIATPENTPLIKKAKEKKIKSIPIEFTFKSAFKDYFALKKIYLELKPDVLNTHGNMDSKIALAAAFKSSIKCRILSRHISADVKPAFYNKLLYNKLCDYVFTTADYTTKHLMETLNVPQSRIFTLPSGINPPEKLTEQLVDKITAQNNLAEELNLNLNQNARFIGFVGRVSEDKGVKAIVKAFLTIADKIPDYHLIIVGDGNIDFINELKQIVDNITPKQLNNDNHKNKKLNNDNHGAKKLNNNNYKNNINITNSKKIHFTGFKENTWSYYRAFDCLVLASREVEGISQSILEAMYSKCPVAASSAGGNCDIIKHGKTGLLFPPDNIEEIGNSILKIVNDRNLSEIMVDNAFKMVVEKYTIDYMIKQISAIYSQADA